MNENKFTVKKAIYALLALIFGMVLAIAFPLPSPSRPPLFAASGYITDPSEDRMRAEHRRIEELRHQLGERARGKPKWWKCDPLDPNRMFSIREIVKTFGEVNPKSLGYRNCTSISSNPYGEEAYAF